MMDGNNKPLKSILPDLPKDGILKVRLKYLSSDHEYYILADLDNHDNDNDLHYTYWSLYHNSGEKGKQRNTPILSMRSLTTDFNYMLDVEQWENDGHKIDISR